MKKERMSMSDEQRERLLISEQIERAQTDAPSTEPSPPVEEGLKRDETTEKVVLSFAPKPPAASSSGFSMPASGLKLNALKANPLKPGVNPLKRPNVFKAASTTSSSTPVPADTEKVAGKKRDAPMSAAERLIFEDQERKRRRMEREAA